MLKKFLVIAALAATLAGCQSAPGSFNGFGSDPMSMVTVTSSSGHVTPDQAVVAAVAANLNKAQIDPQTSSPIETIGVSSALYGGGYAAAGASQALAYAGASATAGMIVNGAVGLVGGGINGAQIWSEGKVTTVGTSTEETLRDWERGRAIPPGLLAAIPNLRRLCQGLHVQSSIVRTNNTTPKDAQTWHGPRAGVPTS